MSFRRYPFSNPFIHTPPKALFTKRRSTFWEPDPVAFRTTSREAMGDGQVSLGTCLKRSLQQWQRRHLRPRWRLLRSCSVCGRRGDASKSTVHLECDHGQGRPKPVALFHNLRLISRMKKPCYVEPAIGWNNEDKHSGVVKYGVAHYEPLQRRAKIDAPARPALLSPATHLP